MINGTGNELSAGAGAMLGSLFANKNNENSSFGGSFGWVFFFIILIFGFGMWGGNRWGNNSSSDSDSKLDAILAGQASAKADSITGTVLAQGSAIQATQQAQNTADLTRSLNEQRGAFDLYNAQAMNASQQTRDVLATIQVLSDRINASDVAQAKCCCETQNKLALLEGTIKSTAQEQTIRDLNNENTKLNIQLAEQKSLHQFSVVNCEINALKTTLACIASKLGVCAPCS